MGKFCPACDKEFPTWEALRVHLKKSLNEPEAADWLTHVSIVEIEAWEAWLRLSGEVAPLEMT